MYGQCGSCLLRMGDSYGAGGSHVGAGLRAWTGLPRARSVSTERMCEGGDRREERRKKVRKLHDDGYGSLDCGLGTARVVVIIRSNLESGRPVNTYTS